MQDYLQTSLPISGRTCSVRQIIMRVEVNRHTLLEIAGDYEAAMGWIAAIGFPVERGRLAEYRSTITELSKNFETDGWGNLDDKIHRERVCTTLFEIRELVSIYRGLSSLTEPDATKGLQHYVKGPFSPISELASNSSNRARNLGFELYLNALFAFAGFRPTYATNADLSFTHRGQTFFVEAKRPTNQTTAAGSIKDANKQLSSRLKQLNNHHARGLIALDLTKVINPESRVMPVFSEDHLYELMFNEDKRQIDELRSHWHSSRHTRTIGVLIHYRMLTNFTETGALNTLKWIGFVMFRDEPSLSEINKKLGGSNSAGLLKLLPTTA